MYVLSMKVCEKRKSVDLLSLCCSNVRIDLIKRSVLGFNTFRYGKYYYIIK